ncbi:MAG TPA: hypothetical protein DEP84_27960 [Chloroflexi bacterium]|nr:hypothetical protein [Chloroflexota bacterium]
MQTGTPYAPVLTAESWGTREFRPQLNQVHPLESTPPRYHRPTSNVARGAAVGRQRTRAAALSTISAARTGVEGTRAQGICSCDLRRPRYVGQARTHLQHLMTMAAITVVRILRWLAGEKKTATRPRVLDRVYQPAA